MKWVSSSGMTAAAELAGAAMSSQAASGMALWRVCIEGLPGSDARRRSKLRLFDGTGARRCVKFLMPRRAPGAGSAEEPWPLGCARAAALALALACDRPLSHRGPRRVFVRATAARAVGSEERFVRAAYREAIAARMRDLKRAALRRRAMHGMGHAAHAPAQRQGSSAASRSLVRLRPSVFDM